MENLTAPNKAQRLLEKLKSPFLHIAAQLPSKTQNPYPHLRHVSPLVAQVAEAVESLSSGRFSLVKNQRDFEELPSRYTPLKMVCHVCQEYSWGTIGRLSAYKDNPGKCCCYCEEPLSLDHIGPTVADVQRFVEVRSGGKVFFSPNNRILGADLTDIFSFNCLKPCHGMHYDTSFAWFLHESRALKSFSEFKAEMTCGCPACTDNYIYKIANRR